MIKMILLCFSGAHLQDVLLLDRRFHFQKGQVLLVSVKNEESMVK